MEETWRSVISVHDAAVYPPRGDKAGPHRGLPFVAVRKTHRRPCDFRRVASLRFRADPRTIRRAHYAHYRRARHRAPVISALESLTRTTCSDTRTSALPVC